MSFDVELAVDEGTPLDLAAVAAHLAAHPDVEVRGSVEGGSFVAGIAAGPEGPWATVEHDDEVFEDDDELAGDGRRLTGLVVSLSYATPDPVVGRVVQVVTGLCDRFALVPVDVQAEEAMSPDGLADAFRRARDELGPG